MPVPLKIASWALDGISYLATQKSMTDHGLSLVVQKDCALLRGFKGEEVCRNNQGDDAGVVLAAAEVEAVGDDVASTAVVEETAPVAAEASVEAVAAKTNWTPPVEKTDVAVQVETPKAAPLKIEATTLAVDATPKPWGELYYVVASFLEIDRADTLLASHPTLDLRVMEGVLDGKSVYRVAAGPFSSGDGTTLRRTIRKQGLKNAWAVRMPASRWTVARGPGADQQLAAVEDTPETIIVD